MTAGRPLIDVRGTLADLQARSASLADAYLRVTLEVDAPAPGLAQRVKEILPEVLEVNLAYPRQEPPPSATHGSREPIDLLRAYYTRERAAELPEEMVTLFQRLYEGELHAAP